MKRKVLTLISLLLLLHASICMAKAEQLDTYKSSGGYNISICNSEEYYYVRVDKELQTTVIVYFLTYDEAFLMWSNLCESGFTDEDYVELVDQCNKRYGHYEDSPNIFYFKDMIDYSSIE